MVIIDVSVSGSFSSKNMIILYGNWEYDSKQIGPQNNISNFQIVKEYSSPGDYQINLSIDGVTIFLTTVHIPKPDFDGMSFNSNKFKFMRLLGTQFR